MQVANKNRIMFDSGSRQVYAMQRLENRAGEHDPRGLIAGFVLSLACWAALGFYLLH